MSFSHIGVLALPAWGASDFTITIASRWTGEVKLEVMMGKVNIGAELVRNADRRCAKTKVETTSTTYKQPVAHQMTATIKQGLRSNHNISYLFSKRYHGRNGTLNPLSLFSIEPTIIRHIEETTPLFASLSGTGQLDDRDYGRTTGGDSVPDSGISRAPKRAACTIRAGPATIRNAGSIMPDEQRLPTTLYPITLRNDRSTAWLRIAPTQAPSHAGASTQISRNGPSGPHASVQSPATRSP